MGRELSGSYGQAPPGKRRHGTNAAHRSNPGRASHCLVYQTATAGAVGCAHDAWTKCCRLRSLWKRGEQVFASVPISLLLLYSAKGEHTASGSLVSTSHQTIIVLLDGSIGAEQALRQATSMAQACQATLVLVAVPPRPGEETFVAAGEQPISGENAQEALKSTDTLQENAQLLRKTTGLRVQTATTARDPEAFLERISGNGPSDLLVVATREQALYGAEKFLRHRNVPVLLLANS
jgi:nucleotide-binding universal stress UspA family protein